MLHQQLIASFYPKKDCSNTETKVFRFFGFLWSDDYVPLFFVEFFSFTLVPRALNVILSPFQLLLLFCNSWAIFFPIFILISTKIVLSATLVSSQYDKYNGAALGWQLQLYRDLWFYVQFCIFLSFVQSALTFIVKRVLLLADLLGWYSTLFKDICGLYNLITDRELVFFQVNGQSF